jgi:hypothetical protein
MSTGDYDLKYQIDNPVNDDVFVSEFGKHIVISGNYVIASGKRDASFGGYGIYVFDVSDDVSYTLEYFKITEQSTSYPLPHPRLFDVYENILAIYNNNALNIFSLDTGNSIRNLSIDVDINFRITDKYILTWRPNISPKLFDIENGNLISSLIIPNDSKSNPKELELNNDYAIIGDYRYNSSEGRVIVFSLPSMEILEYSTSEDGITSPSEYYSSTMQFGSRIKIRDNIIIIGAIDGDSSRGSCYIYEITNRVINDGPAIAFKNDDADGAATTGGEFFIMDISTTDLFIAARYSNSYLSGSRRDNSGKIYHYTII